MASWKPFIATNGPKDRALFIKMSRVESGYVVYLTDLTQIWVERLQRKALMRRAMDENTSIDPTNGPDQCRHLLDHIEKCIRAEPGTQIVVSGDTKKDAILMTLTSELPAPLEPLKWPMTLAREDEASFSRELLYPALDSLQDYRRGLHSLIKVIKEKDDIIQRLQDKLEVAGIGLEAIFPGLGPLKSSKDIQAACQRKFPGLSEFSYQKWAYDLSGSEHDPFANDLLPGRPAIDRHSSDIGQAHLSKEAVAHNDCIPDSQSKLPWGPQSIVQHSKPTSRPSTSPTTTAEAGSTTSSKEFVAESVEAADGQEPINFTEKTVESRQRMGGIGKLGGKKSVDESRLTSTVAETSTPVADQGQVSLPKRGSKLGKIGGVKPDALNSNNAPGDEKIPQNSIGKTELPQETHHGVSADDEPSRMRETSEERADRRRADLKRQIEEKKKVQGTKKKQRKF